jgi:hypothetical protein
MKFGLAASSAALLIGAVVVPPALAQTLAQPYPGAPAGQPYPGTAAYAGAPAAPYAGETGAQPVAGAPATPGYGGSTSYGGVATPNSGPSASAPQTGQASLPQGSYLDQCKEIRMLESTLTAFCPSGDGTWHTTQLVAADRCNGNIEVAGGDLLCRMTPQTGSSAPPQAYVSSAGGATYGAPVPAPVYPPAAPMVSGPYAPTPGALYPAPAYPYGPSQDFYTSPSATRAAQPWGY